MAVEEDNNHFKITCKRCNGFVTCKVRNVDLIYITYPHYVVSTIVRYTEDLYPYFYFQLPAKTKMQCMWLVQDFGGQPCPRFEQEKNEFLATTVRTLFDENSLNQFYIRVFKKLISCLVFLKLL